MGGRTQLYVSSPCASDDSGKVSVKGAKNLRLSKPFLIVKTSDGFVKLNLRILCILSIKRCRARVPGSVTPVLSPSHTFTVLAPVELRFTPIYKIVAHRHDSY